MNIFCLIYWKTPNKSLKKIFPDELYEIQSARRFFLTFMGIKNSLLTTGYIDMNIFVKRKEKDPIKLNSSKFSYSTQTWNNLQKLYFKF